MFDILKKQAKRALLSYPRRYLRREFQTQTFRRHNERPVEFGFVFRKLSEVYPQKVLDVGAGTTALPHIFRNCGFVVTASDNIKDYWPKGMFNRHFHIVDDDITNTGIDDQFDVITCISTLEHIKNHSAAVSNMLSLLRPGGILLMTFPYSENSFVYNVYDLDGSSYGRNNPYITQSFSRREIDNWLGGGNLATIVDQEYWQFWTGEHWTVGEQLIPPRRVTRSDLHQLTCLAIQKTGGPSDSY